MQFAKLSMLGLVFAVTSLTAAPARIDSLAERLSQTANAMASDGYRGFVDRDQGNRRDVQALFLAQQFSAGADLFQRLVRDRRPDSELRDALAILSEQARTSSTFGFGQRYWRDISGTLDEISRELGSGSRGRVDDPRQGDRVNGRMRWHGRIDDRTQVFVQGSSVTAKAVSGNPVSNTGFNFTSPLPQRPLTVEVRKTKGRGSVEIVQQPSRNNGFAAVIEIYDPKGGAEDYEFELIW